MKRFALSLAFVASFASPTFAEEDGLTLMERGAQIFLDGLLKEVEPAMKDLREFAGEMEPALRSFVEKMGPALADLLNEVEDWSAYHPPEILPNGDIILRKKIPEEPTPEGGEIEL